MIAKAITRARPDSTSSNGSASIGGFETAFSRNAPPRNAPDEMPRDADIRVKYRLDGGPNRSRSKTHLFWHKCVMNDAFSSALLRSAERFARSEAARVLLRMRGHRT